MKMVQKRVYAVAIAVCVAIALYFLISKVVSLMPLFGEHAGVSLTQEEIKAAYYDDANETNIINNQTLLLPQKNPQPIPKIIHQIYHDWSGKGLPADWEKLRQTCIDLHPAWQHMVKFCPKPDAIHDAHRC
jgi:mannosyltransferase OCH1-like enzyme